MMRVGSFGDEAGRHSVRGKKQRDINPQKINAEIATRLSQLNTTNQNVIVKAIDLLVEKVKILIQQEQAIEHDVYSAIQGLADSRSPFVARAANSALSTFNELGLATS